MKPRSTPKLALGRAGALAAAIGLLLGASQLPALRGDAAASNAPATPAPTASFAGAPRFADVIERVRPAVVNIATVRELRAGPGRVRMEGRAFGPGGRETAPDDPRLRELFRHFFGDQAPGPVGPRHAQAAGSGFVVDPAGWIVTNRHVVADATTITVTLQDGRHFDATVKGEDEKTDLALLKVDVPQPLPAVAFGDAESARIGDWVIAIGNPFGLGGTATAGIISARGRDIRSGPYDDYLQIDAPINQGNSGGPVFDETGRVIGVNTAIFSPNGGNVGIGFAIPADTVRDVVAQLREHGRVERGWLGVEIQAVTDEIAQGLGLDAARGALVAAVEPGSPAAAAGLAPGDVVTAFAGVPVAEVRDLTRAVARAADGERASIEVWRDGARRQLTARIEHPR
ncbi:MAG: trypsin-like peptidase domain-containing protein, partial [Xanthomonadaceae bacterium]|nr:trypsin-like peptidase domain-containing protein [Xanthomonadaceae bacterium]